MTDVLSKEQRRRCMSSVRSKDTKPEIAVRRLVHSMGYRFRLHKRDLPGNPDMVFAGRRKVIFVHGCFWHRHPGCKRATAPKTRGEFWREKLAGNAERDARNTNRLREAGWDVLVVWECDVGSLDLPNRIRDFLG